jgi:hypothetical protein
VFGDGLTYEGDARGSLLHAGAMNLCRSFALALGLFLSFSHLASAQLPTPSVDSVETKLQSVTILGNRFQPDVIGAPFSAIEESLYSRKQSDGSYEDRSSITTHFYRDNQGRTRAERYVTSYLPGAGKPWLRSIFIADPVAGLLHRLDPENRKATRAPWHAYSRGLNEREIAAANVAFVGELEPHVTTELLGPNTIEGLTAEGTRQTLTVPAEARDDHRLYAVVLETWICPELQVAVLSTRNTPQGRRTTRLTRIDRSEPDPTLFSVPSNYTIEDAPVVEDVASGAIP